MKALKVQNIKSRLDTKNFKFVLENNRKDTIDQITKEGRV